MTQEEAAKKIVTILEAYEDKLEISYISGASEILGAEYIYIFELDQECLESRPLFLKEIARQLISNERVDEITWGQDVNGWALHVLVR